METPGMTSEVGKMAAKRDVFEKILSDVLSTQKNKVHNKQEEEEDVCTYLIHKTCMLT